MLSVNTMQHKGNTYVINFLNYLSTYANVWHQIIHCLGIHFSGVSKLNIVKQKNVLKRPLLTPINEPLTYSDCSFRYASLLTSTVMSWSLMLCFFVTSQNMNDGRNECAVGCIVVFLNKYDTN